MSDTIRERFGYYGVDPNLPTNEQVVAEYRDKIERLKNGGEFTPAPWSPDETKEEYIQYLEERIEFFLKEDDDYEEDEWDNWPICPVCGGTVLEPGDYCSETCERSSRYE